MNYFSRESNNINESFYKKDKKKQPTKNKSLEKLLWDEYLNNNDNNNLQILLKRIKRQRQKKRSKQKNLDAKTKINIFNFPKLLPLSDKFLHVETRVQRTFKKRISDDLSWDVKLTMISDPDTETISSTHLLFRCPVCFEDDRLVAVILQCRHCVCKSCHELLMEMHKDKKIFYSCPVCRQDTSILERRKGPILHYNL